MGRPTIHAKAYLTRIKNVKPGVTSRSKILFCLEKGKKKVSEIAKETNLRYHCIAHHVRSLSSEKIVTPTRKAKPQVWQLTGYGQQKLNS